MFETIAWSVAAALFGLAVGAAEVVARYRDEPISALKQGFLLLALNAIASVAVFLVLVSSPESTFPGLSIGWRAVVAGFGAMVVLRSRLFTFRTKAGDDIPVGVDAVMRAFLAVADRRLDRHQSAARWQMTYRYLNDADNEVRLRDLIAFLGANLRSYQNLGAEDMQAFNGVAAQALTTLKSEPTFPIGLISVNLGLAFQALSGSDNFVSVATMYRSRVGLPAV